MKRRIVFIFVLALASFGCVTIPYTLTVENRPAKFDSLPTDYLCNPEVRIHPQFQHPQGAKASARPVSAC